MHGSGGRVGTASCLLLTGLVETARLGITGVIAIDRHTDAAAVDVVVRFDGIVVAVPGTVVGVRKIGLAPGAIELTVSVPLAGLREGYLTVRGNANDSLFVGRQIEEEPSVAARAGHRPTRSLPVVSNFVPQCDGDCAIGNKCDGEIMAVRIAITQWYQVLAVWLTTIASVCVSTVR